MLPTPDVPPPFSEPRLSEPLAAEVDALFAMLPDPMSALDAPTAAAMPEVTSLPFTAGSSGLSLL